MHSYRKFAARWHLEIHNRYTVDYLGVKDAKSKGLHNVT